MISQLIVINWTKKDEKKNRLFLAGVISKKKECIADTQKTGLSALMTFIYRK